MYSLNSEVIELHLSLFHYHKLVLTAPERSKGCRVACAENFVLATGIIPEVFNFNLTFDIVLTEISRTNLNHVPGQLSTSLGLRLGLVDWGVLTWLEVFVDNKENVARHIFEPSDFRDKHHVFSICLGCHLFSVDLDEARFGMFHIVQHLLHALISRCDNLMESKFKFSDKVMFCEILEVLVIVTVKDLNFESFLLLEVEFNCDLLNPFRVWIVVDDFGLTNLLPHVTLLLV